MFFPRVVAFDRLRGRFELFAPCGVAAGMIARCDENWPVWSAAEGDDAILRPRHAPGLERAQCRSRAPRECRHQPAAGGARRAEVRRQPAHARQRLRRGQRLALPVRAPARAVRHDLHRARHALDAVRAQRPVHLDAWRARRSRPFSIRCMPRARSRAAAASRATSWSATNASTHEETMRAGKINLAFGFAATKPGEYHAFLVTHQPSGSRAQGHHREPLRELFAERRPGDRVEHPARAGAAGARRAAARRR